MKHLINSFGYRFVSAGPDQRRTEVSDATGHVRGSYTYLDDKGVQHSVHYIAGPETGYRVLKHVKGPHLPTVFPFGRPEIIPPDFYDYGKDTDLFDTAASGHIKPNGDKPLPVGTKDEVPSFGNGIDTDKDKFDFGSKIPFAGTKPAGGKPSYFEEDTGDFGDIFGGDGDSSSTTSRPRPGGIYTSQKPSTEEDDGSYKPSGEDGSYKPEVSITTTLKPSYEGTTTSTPNLSSTQGGYDSGEKPYPTFNEESLRPSERPKPTKPSYSGGGKPTNKPSYAGSKPSSEGDSSSNEGNDFGLFGSETGRPKPPYTFGGKPGINIGLNNNLCSKCGGTIVTNLGDKSFYVPPGVSVRAHVQAIDLLPINPSIPSPSDQFNADVQLKTEQLNAAEEAIVTNSEPSKQETTTLITTTSKDTENSTSI